MDPHAWLLFCAMASLATAANAQIYKCVDERGVTHYSDKPVSGCRGKEVDIQPSPPMSGKVQAGDQDTARANAEFNRRRIERERAELDEKAARDAQLQHCAELRTEVGRLSNGRRVVEKRGENGERVFMEDDAREKRLVELRAQLQSCQ
jgi:hypothetical protein